MLERADSLAITAVSLLWIARSRLVQTSFWYNELKVTHNSFRETSRRKAATLHVENLSQEVQEPRKQAGGEVKRSTTSRRSLRNKVITLPQGTGFAAGKLGLATLGINQMN